MLRDDFGAALVEFTILAPFLFALAFGIAEFGRFLYQYQLVVEGLRDAARYLARLDPDDSTNQTNAANLATTGTIDGSGAARVAGWTTGDVTFVITDVDNSAGTYRGPAIIKAVQATTTFNYADVGFLDALGFGAISVDAAHEQRAIEE
ncbi:MAG: TadE/TadG family type IV pilus assembly protein [Dongiaceae bacterium]